MSELHDLTAEQIETLFTAADAQGEAHAWIELCATQGSLTLQRLESLARCMPSPRPQAPTMLEDERLDAGEEA